MPRLGISERFYVCKHPSAAHVTAWEGDRKVHTRLRVNRDLRDVLSRPRDAPSERSSGHSSVQPALGLPVQAPQGRDRLIARHQTRLALM